MVGAAADAALTVTDTCGAAATAGAIFCSSARIAFSDLALVKRSMPARSEEHTSELQSLMRISYAVFCLKKKKPPTTTFTTCLLQHEQPNQSTTHQIPKMN